MVSQFFVICYPYRVEVQDVLLDYEDKEFKRVDAEYLIDGLLHQYQYQRAKNADVGKDWRDRCAIEAHYHARNQGNHIIGIEVPHGQTNKRRKEISDKQASLQFNDNEGIAGEVGPDDSGLNGEQQEDGE
jgi:hypothetical protein